MNVLLIQSYLGGNETPVYPLGLACLKSELDGMNVRVFDPNLSEEGREQVYMRLAEILADFCPDVIGISLRNIDSTNKRNVVFYYDEFIQLVVFLKKHRAKTVIVVGGSGFSMFAETIMNSRPEIDFGIYLEGERTFPALLQSLNAPENVSSIYYRENGRVKFSGAGEKYSLDQLRDPDMTAVSLAEFTRFPESVGIETKRGCPFTCIYCPYGFLNGRSYRLKDPIRIVDFLETLASRNGISSFTFTDSIFNVPVSHAEAILTEMIRRNLRLSWSGWFSERELDENFVRLAIQAGCRNFIFSPDAFSNNILKKLGKSLSRKEIVKSLRMMSRTQTCDVSYNFFKNPPGQSIYRFISLILFCIIAKWKLGKRVHFEFNALRVEPHTALYDIAISEGILQPGDDVLHPVYYTQKKTAYIETVFNLALKLAGK